MLNVFALLYEVVSSLLRRVWLNSACDVTVPWGFARHGGNGVCMSPRQSGKGNQAAYILRVAGERGEFVSTMLHVTLLYLVCFKLRGQIPFVMSLCHAVLCGCDGMCVCVSLCHWVKENVLV